ALAARAHLEDSDDDIGLLGIDLATARFRIAHRPVAQYTAIRDAALRSLGPLLLSCSLLSGLTLGTSEGRLHREHPALKRRLCLDAAAIRVGPDFHASIA